jgi:predicted glycogen debranching enzyme
VTLREWLIADGLGGYAMGTEDGIRTRRYHGLLLAAARSSERRFMLVNGVEAWVETAHGIMRLTQQRYAPDVTEKSSHSATFTPEPWPKWDFGRAAHEVFGVKGHPATVLGWTLGSGMKARLHVRPLISGRDWHALHRENAAFRFDVQAADGRVSFAPYPSVPAIHAHSNGTYRHAPQWYRQFQYDEERARGQDFIEDLASPGVFTFDLSPESPDAWLVFTTPPEMGGVDIRGEVGEWCRAARDVERVRLAAFPSGMERLAELFIVRRGQRQTIIAGYPWFTDWGRDTFISVRGLCIAQGRLAEAEAILLSWCDHLSQGMMPNLFPSGQGKPEYNSVDASLWFVIAVHDLAKAMSGDGVLQVPLKFIAACEDILTHYARGTRHSIRVDSDGLLAAGEPGLALTWMDAVVDGKPVTPRIGKPVEVQALWINALEFASTWNTRWTATATKARESFARRFWNAKLNCLFDVVDVDHVPGTADARIRPNQVFACGGLPQRLVTGGPAKTLLETVDRKLKSEYGFRTLARDDPGYIGRADGPLRQRDLAYHQGTVWPWLTFAFIDAAIRALGDGAGPVLSGTSKGERLWDNGLPWIEILDGDEPHHPRGCPYQAWTVAESIRHLRLIQDQSQSS